VIEHFVCHLDRFQINHLVSSFSSNVRHLTVGDPQSVAKTATGEKREKAFSDTIRHLL